MTSTITVITPKPNRQLLSQAFGMNQMAVRFLESMAQDITITLPDAIEANGPGAAILFAQMLSDAYQVAPRAPHLDPLAAMLADASVRTRDPMATLGLIALLDSNGRIAQAPGNYEAQQPLVGYAKNSTTGTSLTNGVTANATSLNLSAGTWDVSGVVVFNAASTTVIEQVTAGIATVSGTLGTPDTYQQLPMAFTDSSPVNLRAPQTRIVLAAAATVYLVAQSQFNTSTMSADGYIQARPGF